MDGFSKLRDIDLQDQVSQLSKEVAALRRSLGRRGSSPYAESRDTARDLYADIAERLTDALPVARKRARAVERAVHDNPTAAAAVGLVVLGLIATFIFSSRRD